MSTLAARLLLTAAVFVLLSGVPSVAQEDDDNQDRALQGEQGPDRPDAERNRSFRDEFDARQDQEREDHGPDQDYQADRDDRYDEPWRREGEGEREGTRRRGQTDQEQGGLGVTLSDDARQGVRVRGVFRGSPADDAGLRSGDAILEVDGQRVDSPQTFASRIRQKDPDSQVELVVDRNGQIRTLVARLESRREALSAQQRQGRESRYYESFRRDTSQGQGGLIDHIVSLERRIERLSDEIADLREMVASELRMGRAADEQERRTQN
jgi:hypothetical protein